MEFKYENGQLSISQEKYVNKLLDEFGMTHCKTVETPMVLSKVVKTTIVCDVNYRKLIGGLLYIATNTRPDISSIIYCYEHTSRYKLQCCLLIAKFEQSIINRLRMWTTNSTIP